MRNNWNTCPKCRAEGYLTGITQPQSQTAQGIEDKIREKFKSEFGRKMETLEVFAMKYSLEQARYAAQSQGIGKSVHYTDGSISREIEEHPAAMPTDIEDKVQATIDRMKSQKHKCEYGFDDEDIGSKSWDKAQDEAHEIDKIIDALELVRSLGFVKEWSGKLIIDKPAAMPVNEALENISRWKSVLHEIWHCGHAGLGKKGGTYLDEVHIGFKTKGGSVTFLDLVTEIYRYDTAALTPAIGDEEREKELLSQGLDLCVRGRLIDENPSSPIWIENQYHKSLSEWETKVRDYLNAK